MDTASGAALPPLRPDDTENRIGEPPGPVPCGACWWLFLCGKRSIWPDDTPGPAAGSAAAGRQRSDRLVKAGRNIYGQASRPISTGQLRGLPHFHLRPINLVVSQGPSVRPKAEGIPNLGGGFALICFQRLSFSDIATQRCSWRNNWYTRGPPIPVLSY